MKKLFPFLFLIIIASCNKQEVAHKQMPPMDKELFNPAKDAEIAAKKNPNHGNPHNNPGDTTTNPPPPIDTKKACIYYDFDGQIVSKTLWNTSGTIVCDNSGLDATAQQDAVTRSQQHYSFNPNIKVTSNEAEFYSYPINKRVRIIVTSTAFYGNVGGVAYVNSFTWGDDTPCFVFSSLLGYNSEYVSDAGSHEASHTLGNRHQSDYDANCIKTNEYSDGKIMGYPYNPSPVWWVGTSSNCCTCIQDDIQIINNTINQ